MIIGFARCSKPIEASGDCRVDTKSRQMEGTSSMVHRSAVRCYELVIGLPFIFHRSNASD